MCCCFFTIFIHLRQMCFFLLSICKSNTPLTSVIMNLKTACFHGFCRTVSGSSCYFGENSGQGKRYSFTVTILWQCKLLKMVAPKNLFIMKLMRRLTDVWLCAIFSNEICNKWTYFTKGIPENKIKFSLPKFYSIAKSDPTSCTNDNPESPF